MSENADKQTLGFQTEVNQLLYLVVHSLYSNKEIFLRELISNSSDALDKLRFIALSNSNLYGNDADLAITISFDEPAKTITISDNGIGMTRAEIIENLGTIAKSGTKEFLSHLTGDQSKDSHLIGQFGVGFYSAFVVADKVIVKSRKAGTTADQGVMWTSTGDGNYTVETIEKPSRGTTITLHLKSEENDLLSDWRLRSIITKYSDHICWPIVMQKMAKIEKEDDQDKDTPKEVELETVNKATALWTLAKNEISDEQYIELYKHISHDFEAPLLWLHNQVEGKHHYTSLLYIPARAPFDLWQPEVKHGLKLYVKRVFILDDAAQFLPRYLRFVKGIIDSSDLPLNVSREILQDNKLIETIKTASVKRIVNSLEKLSKDDPEKYQKFWNEFGLVLKEGPIEDFANRETVAKLLRFSSTHSDSDTQNVSLDDYLARVKPNQDKIYYITASSFNAAKHSPHLELFRKKGIEVLLLSDRVDEWLVGHLAEYNGKSLHSITKGKIDLGDLDEAPKEQQQQDEQQYSSLLEHVKKVLTDKVKDVQLTYRLTDSPACIVADEHDMGLEMQRILKAAGQSVPSAKPILELNPQHLLVQKLNQETDDAKFKEWAELLFEQAVLAEGGHLEDPASFVSRVNKMLLALAK